ncbi:MAG TPA: hypothetical protein PLD95_02395 [bacterium]|nr:MAG: hypothetical protein BWX59_00814 [Bacteroidetes bacterium ADurb.Bin028]HOG38300.1 hypothetical protein [bacterium]
MEKTLILVRGLPGSGKTTFSELFGKTNICSNDDYHMVKGKYEWKKEKEALARFECQKKCERLMTTNTPTIVVANTLTTSDEMSPYYILADKYNYRVFSVIVENRHDGISLHNVPNDTIQEMRNRFEIKL